MTDWKDDLTIKAKQMNIGGGETNGSINRDSGNRSSGIHRISDSTQERNRVSSNQVSNQGGVAKMITIEGALSDIEKIEKDGTITADVKVLRAVKVLLKFLSTMRSNQLLTEEEKKKIQETQKAREKKPQ